MRAAQKKYRIRYVNMVFLILVSMLISLPISVYAQEGGSEKLAGSLIYASGTGFEIVRNAQSEEYDLTSDIVEGLEFYSGDYLNTYDGTFLEIQVSGSRNVLKISENTSFKFEQRGETRSSRYEVSYGRVRARVRKLAGLEKFTVSGPSMVAGVRGTDFGYDVLYSDEENTTIANVYCFEGKVEVTPKVKTSDTPDSEGTEEGRDEGISSGPEKIEIGADEMVRIKEIDEGTSEQHYVFRKEPISTEVYTFWEQNDFKSTPIEVDSADDSKIAEKATKTEETPPGLQFQFTKSQLRRGSLLTAGIGAVFGAAALTFAYADPLVGGMSGDQRDNLTLSMSISSGLFFSTSLVTFIASLF